MFFLFSLLLVALTVVALLFPILWKQSDFLGRKTGTMAILRDQLNEIDADVKRNVLSAAEAEGATIEIKRRILALEKSAPNTDQTAKNNVSKGQGRWLLATGAVLAPAFAVGLYSLLGSPETASQPYASRVEETQELARMAEVTARLQQRLEADPESPTEGWILLGQTYMRMNRYDDAVYVFEKLIKRSDASSGTFSQYAEALVAAERGLVTPKAEAAADRALVLDTDNVAGTYYKALALEQSGAQKRAFDMLKERLERETAFAQWMPTLLAQANRIAATIGEQPVRVGPVANLNMPAPTTADIEAAGAMSQEDRQAFIRSMVDRLATRLEEEPEDLDGWLRLARAYLVLGERAKALEAYRSAEKLLEPLPASDERHRIVRQGLDQLEG